MGRRGPTQGRAVLRRLCQWAHLLACFAGLLAASQHAFGAREVIKSEMVEPWVKSQQADLEASRPASGSQSELQFLLVDRQLHAEEQASYHHYAYRLLTESGVQSTSQLSITFDPAYETVTLHQLRVVREGRPTDRLGVQEIKVLQRESGAERQVYDGLLTAVMVLSDIRVGDIVEYAYTIRGGNPLFEGRFSAVLNTRWTTPVHHARLSVAWHESRPVRWNNHMSKTAPVFERDGDLLVAVLEERSIPAVLGDGDLPSGVASHSWLEFSEYRHWEEISTWAAKQFPQEEVLPDDAVRELQRLQALPRMEDRVIGALRWVQDSVRYVGFFEGLHTHRPYPLGEVVARRFGDCKDKSHLLVSMLRAMGVECFVGLVSVQSQGAVAEWLPTPNAFDHAVVGVRVGGGIRWMDATMSFQRGGFENLFFPDYGMALPVVAGATLVDIVPSGYDQTSVEVDEHFDFEDYRGSVRFKVESRYSGSQADGMRAHFATYSLEEIEKSYLNAYSKRYPKIQILGRLSFRDDEGRNEFTTEEEYELSDVWKPAPANGAVLQFVFSADLIIAELFRPASLTRSLPFRLPHPRNCLQRVHVNFPTPLELNNFEDVVENPSFTLRVKEASTDAATTVSYHYQSKCDRVTAEETQAYVSDLEKANQQLSYTITVPKQYADTPVDEITEDTGTFSPPWSLIIVGGLSFTMAAMFCVMLYFWDPSPRRGVRDVLFKDGPAGLRGWLILVGAHAVLRLPAQVFACYDNLSQMNDVAWNAITTAGSQAYNPLWEPFLMIDVALCFAFVPFQMLLVILFFRRRTLFPRLMIAGYILLFLVHVVEIGFFSLLPSVEESVKTEHLGETVRVAIAALVWIPYLLLSQRVRNTFVRQRRPQLPPPPGQPPPLPRFAPDPVAAGIAPLLPLVSAVQLDSLPAAGVHSATPEKLEDDHRQLLITPPGADPAVPVPEVMPGSSATEADATE